MMVRMKELEAENARLKKMYIEEKLKAEIVTEALAKKWWAQSRRREMAQQAVRDKAIPIRLACQAFRVSEELMSNFMGPHTLWGHPRIWGEYLPIYLSHQSKENYRLNTIRI